MGVKDISWLRVKNTTNPKQVIPAFAVMAPVAPGTDSTGALTVSLPTADSMTNVLFNGPNDIQSGSYGQATYDMPADVLYDPSDGVPSPPQTWGTKTGLWTLKKANNGFTIIGLPLGASAGVATVIPATPTSSPPFVGTLLWGFNGGIMGPTIPSVFSSHCVSGFTQVVFDTAGFYNPNPVWPLQQGSFGPPLQGAISINQRGLYEIGAAIAWQDPNIGTRTLQLSATYDIPGAGFGYFGVSDLSVPAGTPVWVNGSAVFGYQQVQGLLLTDLFSPGPPGTKINLFALVNQNSGSDKFLLGSFLGSALWCYKIGIIPGQS